MNSEESHNDFFQSLIIQPPPIRFCFDKVSTVLGTIILLCSYIYSACVLMLDRSETSPRHSEDGWFKQYFIYRIQHKYINAQFYVFQDLAASLKLINAIS